VKTVGPSVDAARLERRLGELAEIGRDARGGLSRFAFTPAHTEACLLVAGWMREAGLTPFLDPAGNLTGADRQDGPAIAAGSHLDTVPMGGRLDGALGVVAAVECAQALHERGAALRHPLAVLAFADEEGHTFGVGCLTSRALVGGLPSDRMAAIRDAEGRSLADRVASWACPLPRRAPATIAAFVELHIEQGPRLDAEGLDLAAATAIAGISRTTVTFLGAANHAGTTPMPMRRDALWGASALILEVRRLALATGGEAVGTVGRIEAEPGGTNVVPGKAVLRVELRSGREEVLAALRAEVEAAARRLAGEFALQANVDPWDHAPAVPLHPDLQAMALEAAAREGLRAIGMPSWAGHDAKNLAPHVPTGLIFVPSARGVSHAPGEHTDPSRLAAGAQVLLEVLCRLDGYLIDHGRSQ
jgi:hydantoinase/carbamoylase family amidase